MSRSVGRRVVTVSGLCLWALATLTGFALLMSYGQTAGPRADSATLWPSDSRIVRATHRTTLILFVHPHCPCSRASVSELERLLAHGVGRIDAHVVFVRPSGAPADWEKSDLVDSVSGLRDVQASIDERGEEAHRFGAVTSGTVLVYDASGILRFAGGITPSRGHAGDSVGRASVLSILNGGTAASATTPVFGCPLLDEAVGENEEPCKKP